MFASIKNAITDAFKWLLNALALKAAVFGILFSLVAALGSYLISKIAAFTGTDGLSNTFAAIPPGVWYYVDLFRLDFGLPLVISAYVARFLIRRIPVIG